ncbi:hypothetical protein HYH03_006440 [Edaphochlamys debaryana]|uniref:Uncharacterized protein n=1 Tax=Edaphochlamys debaryana TaxID=47281 RepID=A0A835Y3W8_9CHLO|nr:hypothetical protein HYH03_006440 [Edaphochlamys debaryana]|eukprot:KAG2495496.1 hypothetical protein HYH03_006440 [Edaphochlamys debaryana]
MTGLLPRAATQAAALHGPARPATLTATTGSAATVGARRAAGQLLGLEPSQLPRSGSTRAGDVASDQPLSLENVAHGEAYVSRASLQEALGCGDEVPLPPRLTLLEDQQAGGGRGDGRSWEASLEQQPGPTVRIFDLGPLYKDLRPQAGHHLILRPTAPPTPTACRVSLWCLDAAVAAPRPSAQPRRTLVRAQLLVLPGPTELPPALAGLLQPFLSASASAAPSLSVLLGCEGDAAGDPGRAVQLTLSRVNDRLFIKDLAAALQDSPAAAAKPKQPGAGNQAGASTSAARRKQPVQRAVEDRPAKRRQGQAAPRKDGASRKRSGGAAAAGPSGPRQLRQRVAEPELAAAMEEEGADGADGAGAVVAIRDRKMALRKNDFPWMGDFLSGRAKALEVTLSCEGGPCDFGDQQARLTIRPIGADDTSSEFKFSGLEKDLKQVVPSGWDLRRSTLKLTTLCRKKGRLRGVLRQHASADAALRAAEEASQAAAGAAAAEAAAVDGGGPVATLGPAGRKRANEGGPSPPQRRQRTARPAAPAGAGLDVGPAGPHDIKMTVKNGNAWVSPDQVDQLFWDQPGESSHVQLIAELPGSGTRTIEAKLKSGPEHVRLRLQRTESGQVVLTVPSQAALGPSGIGEEGAGLGLTGDAGAEEADDEAEPGGEAEDERGNGEEEQEEGLAGRSRGRSAEHTGTRAQEVDREGLPLPDAPVTAALRDADAGQAGQQDAGTAAHLRQAEAERIAAASRTLAPSRLPVPPGNPINGRALVHRDPRGMVAQQRMAGPLTSSLSPPPQQIPLVQQVPAGVDGPHEHLPRHTSPQQQALVDDGRPALADTSGGRRADGRGAASDGADANTTVVQLVAPPPPPFPQAPAGLAMPPPVIRPPAAAGLTVPGPHPLQPFQPPPPPPPLQHQTPQPPPPPLQHQTPQPPLPPLQQQPQPPPPPLQHQTPPPPPPPLQHQTPQPPLPPLQQQPQPPPPPLQHQTPQPPPPPLQQQPQPPPPPLQHQTPQPPPPPLQHQTPQPPPPPLQQQPQPPPPPLQHQTPQPPPPPLQHQTPQPPPPPLQQQPQPPPPPLQHQTPQPPPPPLQQQTPQPRATHAQAPSQTQPPAPPQRVEPAHGPAVEAAAVDGTGTEVPAVPTGDGSGSEHRSNGRPAPVPGGQVPVPPPLHRPTSRKGTLKRALAQAEQDEVEIARLTAALADSEKARIAAEAAAVAAEAARVAAAEAQVAAESKLRSEREAWAAERQQIQEALATSNARAIELRAELEATRSEDAAAARAVADKTEEAANAAEDAAVKWRAAAVAAQAEADRLAAQAAQGVAV